MRSIALVLFISILASIDTDAQALSHEVGYNLEHYQRATALTASEEGAYYAIQYQSSGFTSSAQLYNTDASGELSWTQPFTALWGEVTEINEIVKEGDFIYVAGSVTACCDCSAPYGFLAKYDLDGQLIWVHSHEVESFDWFNGFAPRNLHRDVNENWVYELRGWDDFSVMIRMDDEGVLVDSIPLSSVQGGTDMLTLNDGNIAFLKDSFLYKLNSTGDIQETLELPSTGISLLVKGDSLLVLEAEGIEVFDNQFQSLGIAHNWDNYQAIGFKSSGTGIRLQLRAPDGIHIQELSSSFDLLFEQTIETELQGFILFDSNLESAYLLEAFPLTEQNSIRYRAFDLSGTENQEVPRTEVEPTSLLANDVELTSYVSGDYNIVTLSFDHSILIKNNGPAELTECRINRFVNFGICAYAYYTEEFQNLTIAPGDSAWIDVGFTGFYQNAYALGDTITYSTCFFTSNPNGLVDLVVENDEICDTYQFIITDVPEESKHEFSIFPNPASDVLHIESVILGQRYTVYDLDGRNILAGSVENGTIDISAIANGNYMLSITSNNGAFSIQRFSVVR
jgi:hypothetical protein